MAQGINWRSVDLNLLVAFHALYQHRSVSLAAEQNCVSQSAMSHSLARLRTLFGDPLFERQGYVMVPSDYAQHIAPTIEQLLVTVSDKLLHREAFSSDSYQGVVRMGLSDYAEFIFAPTLYDALRQQAPQAQISFIHVNHANYQKLIEQEKLDLVIGSIPNPPAQFESLTLYQEQHVCLFDPKRVAVDEITDVARFAKVEQALVSADGNLVTGVDSLLANLGLTRRVTVASRHFLTVRRLIGQRRLVAIVPRLMAMAPVFADNLASITPPIPVADFEIGLLWHRSRTNEEKNRWLRELVQRIVNTAV
ncbi:LysR family transcriptional regulator [Vibrio sp. SM6]|uniref:LysR family transcriptional regulator n=1 Tax=Vibrio agarilyticus TaxID=2726741 RepID=A0A7X8TQD4_9VIBR|nr:LysR family transcriptional regulator [Vibrio agarilyticus]NLS12692.1 LysR family transcriptional regulator [Vibrio agarilyticus]